MSSSRNKTNGFLSRVFRRLNARTTGAATLSDGRRTTIRLAATFIALVVVLLLLRWVLRLYFFGGGVFGLHIPAPTVSRIEITAGEAIPRNLLLEYLNLREGMPFFDPKEGLFARDLSKLRDKVFKAATPLATLSIFRTTSNVVSVVSTERIPLARFETEGNGRRTFLIDREAVVFVGGNGINQLPIITGYSEKALTPGLRISSHRMIASALELLQCLEAGQSELRKGFVDSIDVSKTDYLICEMTDGRSIKLAWKEMGRCTDTGRKWLISQLDGYVKSIQNPSSRDRRVFDLRIPGHNYAQ